MLPMGRLYDTRLKGLLLYVRLKVALHLPLSWPASAVTGQGYQGGHEQLVDAAHGPTVRHEKGLHMTGAQYVLSQWSIHCPAAL
jgi:hypothetical protein